MNNNSIFMKFNNYEMFPFFHGMVSVFFSQLYLWCSLGILPAFSSTVV